MIGISDWQKEDAAGDGTGTARPGSPASLHSSLRRRMTDEKTKLLQFVGNIMQETSRLLMDCYHGEDELSKHAAYATSSNLLLPISGVDIEHTAEGKFAARAVDCKGVPPSSKADSCDPCRKANRRIRSKVS
mmetsp:Transcript_4484/g.9739  ORF Transcript_4484/g.9739 Transcript_4484/m.9739 type:complete len:132 (+) Transcript_4484:393-788(+)